MEIIEAKQSMEIEVRSYVDTLEIRVTDSASCILAAETLKEIKRRMKLIDDRLDPEKKKAYVAYQAWNDLIKELKAPYLEKETHIKKELSAYDQEQERIRREEESRLREIARKEEEERRLQEAIAAEKSGQKEEAEAILEERPYVPPIVLPKMTPKVEGISYRENWTFKIIDQRKIPHEFMTPDMTKIGQMVRALKGQTNISGIEVYSERIVAAGRR